MISGGLLVSRWSLRGLPKAAVSPRFAQAEVKSTL